jgi:hypothetical protein
LPKSGFDGSGRTGLPVRGRHASGSNNEREDRTSRNRSFVSAIACGLALGAGGGTVLAQGSVSDPAVAGDLDTSAVGKIGRLHDNLRRAAARRALSAEAVDVYDDYLALKARVATQTGLAWSMDLSYLQQWGRPDGGSPAGQILATPSIEWTLFDGAASGAGSVQLAYVAARYGTDRSATKLQSNLGLVTPINDYPARQNTFSQLTYTQALPNNKLLISAGQYPISNFDGNPYLGNQQQNFNNYTLAQNASATYAQAGLGAYIQVNATRSLQFVAGLQNASNITGATLSTDGFGKYGSSWFGYAHWTPAFKGYGSAQYSFTYYQVPTVPAQPRSTGWSLNAAQNLDETWALFGRANRAYGFVTPIRASYALGAAMNNPLGRSPTDQIALAYGVGDASPPTPPSDTATVRDGRVLEAYWTWTFGKGLLVTPDVQYFADRAATTPRTDAWVLSLRATLMF